MLKKWFVILVFLSVFSAALAVSPPHVTDHADLFSSEEELFLAEQIRSFQIGTAMDFAVLTTSKDLQGKSQAEIADTFYDENNFGLGVKNSGILFYIDMHNRIPYLSTCGDAVAYLDSARLEAAHEIAYEALKKGRYSLAVVQIMAAIQAFIHEGLPLF